MSTTTSPGLRGGFAGLVDDAAIFPPGNAPMPDALRAHGNHQNAWYADLVGPFVCSDTRLPELEQALDTTNGAALPLRVSLTITGGAGAVDPALTWVQRDDRLALAGVEAALRDEADLAHNASRLTTVLATSLPEDAAAFVEVPRLYGAEATAGWLSALDEVAAAGHRLKYRTGGADSDAFPTADELAVVITAALDREVEFKLTAGLHHAVRHTAGDTGFEHHGFLNVLLATRAGLDGAGPADLARLLEERDPAVVARWLRELGADRLTATRRWFTSFGSCSIDEPVGDLVDLDLISRG
jgi:hypothetical protein